MNVLEMEYKLLDSSVRQRVASDLFATTVESATANYLELIMMRDDPDYFADKELLAEVDVKDTLDEKIIDKGEPLDTAQKCTDYATRLIEIAKEYAVYRHKKKDEFRAFKNSQV